MKIIIIGLGNFGSALAIRLIQDGHDVIGVDSNEVLVNSISEKLTHTLIFDSTNENAIRSLPLTDTDVIIVAIGEDVGASVTTTALLKKYGGDTRIIARAISSVHQTIIEAMGINEIINPEFEYANEFAHRITILGSIKTLLLDEDYEIAEFKVPSSFVGKKVRDLDLINTWHVSLVTIMTQLKTTNILGFETSYRKVKGVVTGLTELNENDTLVLFGPIKYLKSMMDALKNGES